MTNPEIPKEVRKQMEWDAFIYGNGYCLCEDGKYRSISPEIIIHCLGAFKIKK